MWNRTQGRARFDLYYLPVTVTCVFPPPTALFNQPPPKNDKYWVENYLDVRSRPCFSAQSFPNWAPHSSGESRQQFQSGHWGVSSMC